MISLFRISFIISFLILLPAACAGQSKSALKQFQNAREAIAERDYEKAMKSVDKALKKDENFKDALLLKADLLRKSGKPEEAPAYYKRVLQQGGQEYVWSMLAETYFEIQQYEKAMDAADKYLRQPRTHEAARIRMQRLYTNAVFGAEAIKNPYPFSPENLGENINDEKHQYFPSIDAEGNTLVFTERAETGDKRDEDFYVSTKENGEWSPKTPLPGSLNTPQNEGAQSLSADGNVLFFAGCTRPDGFGSCDIYVSFRNRQGQWSRPRNLGPSINTAAWESMPSISPDGRTLYFARGKTGRDSKINIYYSELSDEGEWSEAQPVPGKVNTSEREITPFIYFDNNSLYFASDGHPGLGDLDFFVSRRQEDGSWGEPKNLGYPVNSPREESSLVISPDGKTGYFAAADREGGFGGLDLYSFEVPLPFRSPPVSFLEGIVVDKKTDKPIPSASLEVISLSNQDTIWQQKSAKNGEFFMILPANADYAISVDKEEYLFFSDNFAMEDENYEAPKFLRVELNRIEKGRQIVLRNIFFDYDSDNLKEESETELNRTFRLLQNQPQMHLEISGHTDNQGSDSYNTDLSLRRAQAVVNYLIQKGISKNRLKSIGKAAREPIADNDTEAGRAQNRRIEMKVF